MTEDHDEATGPGDRLSQLTVGSSIRVSDLSDALGGYSATITSDTGQLLWIDIPIRRDGMLTLSVGQLVSVRFDRPGDAVYLFDTVVAEVRADDESPYALARPVTIDRRRHRSDVRLALVLDAEYQMPGDPEAQAQRAKVIDLSAGGLGLITQGDHEVGAALVVSVVLPGPGEAHRFESSVVIRTRSLYGRSPGGAVLRQYGLEFVDVSDQIRDRILALVIWNLTQNPAVL